MAQQGLIVRGLIASPAGTEKWRRVVREAFAKWNASHSHEKRLIFEPVGWESHASAGAGQHPQEFLNETMVRKCDFVIAVFSDSLGMPTPSMQSGSIEEIDLIYKLRGGDRVFVYFLSSGTRGSAKLRKFKEFIKDSIYYQNFTRRRELADFVTMALSTVATSVGREFDELAGEGIPPVLRLKAQASLNLEQFKQ